VLLLQKGTASELVRAICTYGEDDGADELCPYRLLWGCPPWFKVGQPHLPITCESMQPDSDSMVITFTIGRLRCVERRDAISWPWLTCPFRIKGRGF